MPETNLRLVKEEPTDAIPLERRIDYRHTISGRVTALQTTAGSEEHHNRICSLQLLNISDSGLGAVTQEPVELNTRIVVFFPPHGPERGFDKYGQVVRCVHRDGGHELGIRFESQLQAA
ncbi:MAG: hypothetical protein GC164_06810 [Phycisphaera sp.]|nr:hypothetical protein [Phycisphaera sp.]